MIDGNLAYWVNGLNSFAQKNNLEYHKNRDMIDD